ncbi:MAG: Holliday junction branch migration protein RuvA [Muribaculaceae bacterium]|nr:Holliday junction branch migration protein RuvA [Muribaculaceae bacterium]
MLDYIIGEITELSPTTCVLDNHGIGYEIFINLIDYGFLDGKKNCKLYIHESIREDAHQLFGFVDKRGRGLFRLLIGVSGVGPNTGRLIMSSMTADQIEDAISSGNDSLLKSVKGIGGKTAQRIIVDLKDKINITESTLSSNSGGNGESYEDALSALTMLGFNILQSKKVLKKLFADSPSMSAEEAIRQALKLL